MYANSLPLAEHELPTFASWPYVEVVQDDDTHTWPYRVFKSSSWTPPNITITVNRGELAEGLLFLDPKSRGKGKGQKQNAPIIVDTNNELVYAHKTPYGTNNFRVQDLNGESRLSFWHGDSVLGHGYGNVVVMDETYHESTVSLDTNLDCHLPKSHGKPAGLIDFHEAHLTSRGTLLVSVYNNTQWDLTPIGGSADGWLCDSMFFEIDLATNKVLFSWSALDHLTLEASRLPVKSYMGDGSSKSPWDHFHINSIQDLEEGFLVSSRHMWGCYLISKTTGEIIWTLDGGGNVTDFGGLTSDGQFRWQHDARAHNVTKNSMWVSIFDNHSTREDQGTGPTKGLMLELALPPDASKSPKVLRSLPSGELPYVDSQGSYQSHMSNGNQLLGFGPISVIREFGPGSDGADLLWEGRFGHDFTSQSYRAYKGVWRGTPAKWDPHLVLYSEAHNCDKQGHDQCIRAHVSWNGATDVDWWSVYTGQRAWGGKLAGKAFKKGFETVFDIPASAGRLCLQVGAVQSGKEVRLSNKACSA